MIQKRVDDITANLSVRVYKAFHIKQDADWFEKKTKTVYTIWTITKGKVWLEIDNHTYVVDPGSVILFYPNDHYTAHTDQNGCEFMYLFFTLEMGSGIDLMADMNLAGIIPPQDFSSKALSFCRSFLSMTTVNQQMSLRSYAMFMVHLCDILDMQRRSSAVRFHHQAGDQRDASLVRILDYISENYRNPISVKQLAQIANISEKRFINSFNYMVGTSPGQYITQCRMREAAEMLMMTNRSIREIALHVGYSDQYAFSKAFKRSFGESPTTFRRNALPTQ